MVASGKKLGKFTIIAIVGMHRSGTSLAAETVQKTGVPLGAHLLEANEFNKRGYFEDLKVVEVHDQLLSDLDRSWGSIRHTFSLPDGWETSKAANRARSRIRTYLKREIAKHGSEGVWGVKDPRMSLFMPLWARVAKDMSANLKTIYCLRGVEEVALSLKRRDGLPEEASRLIWMNYNAQIVRNTRDIPTTAVLFDDWKNAPQKTVERLAKFCGMPKPKADSIVFDRTFASSSKKKTTGLADRWEKAIAGVRTTHKVTEKMRALAGEHLLFLDNIQIWSQFIDEEIVRGSVYERLEKDVGNYRSKVSQAVKAARKNLKAYKITDTELVAERKHSAELTQVIMELEQTIKNLVAEADKNLEAYRTVDGWLNDERAKVQSLTEELKVSVDTYSAALKKMTTNYKRNRTMYLNTTAELAEEREKSEEMAAIIAGLEETVKSVTLVADENLEAYRKADSWVNEERAKVKALEQELERKSWS